MHNHKMGIWTEPLASIPRKTSDTEIYFLYSCKYICIDKQIDCFYTLESNPGSPEKVQM